MVDGKACHASDFWEGREENRSVRLLMLTTSQCRHHHAVLVGKGWAHKYRKEQIGLKIRFATKQRNLATDDQEYIWLCSLCVSRQKEGKQKEIDLRPGTCRVLNCLNIKITCAGLQLVHAEHQSTRTRVHGKSKDSHTSTSNPTNTCEEDFHPCVCTV